MKKDQDFIAERLTCVGPNGLDLCQNPLCEHPSNSLLKFFDFIRWRIFIDIEQSLTTIEVGENELPYFFGRDTRESISAGFFTEIQLEKEARKFTILRPVLQKPLVINHPKVGTVQLGKSNCGSLREKWCFIVHAFRSPLSSRIVYPPSYLLHSIYKKIKAGTRNTPLPSGHHPRIREGGEATGLPLTYLLNVAPLHGPTKTTPNY